MITYLQTYRAVRHDTPGPNNVVVLRTNNRGLHLSIYKEITIVDFYTPIYWAVNKLDNLL